MYTYRLMTKFWQFSRPLPLVILKSIWRLPSSDGENQGDNFLKECVTDTKISNHVQSSKIMILSECKHESSFMMRNTARLIWKKVISTSIKKLLLLSRVYRKCTSSLQKHMISVRLYALLLSILYFHVCIHLCCHLISKVQIVRTFENTNPIQTNVRKMAYHMLSLRSNLNYSFH